MAQRVPWTNPYARLLVGVGLLLVLFALAALTRIGGSVVEVVMGLLLVGAIFVTWLAGTAGLGAVFLSRFGYRRDYAGPAAPEPPPAPVAAPAGAPEEPKEG